MTKMTKKFIDMAVKQSIKQYGKTYKMLAGDKMVEKKRRIEDNDWLTIGAYLSTCKPKVLQSIIDGTMLIPSLDGKGKMSKSGQDLNMVIWLTDSQETIEKKIAKIPSKPEFWHIFFFYFWNFVLKTQEEKNNFSNQLVAKVNADAQKLGVNLYDKR